MLSGTAEHCYAFPASFTSIVFFRWMFDFNMIPYFFTFNIKVTNKASVQNHILKFSIRRFLSGYVRSLLGADTLPAMSFKPPQRGKLLSTTALKFTWKMLKILLPDLKIPLTFFTGSWSFMNVLHVLLQMSGQVAVVPEWFATSLTLILQLLKCWVQVFIYTMGYS